MNDAKLALPVFKPKVRQEFLTATSTPLETQSSINSSSNEELLPDYSTDSIDWNKLSSELKNCCDQVVRNEVSMIELGYNSVGSQGAIAIAEALKVNSSVSGIYLHANSIGNEGAIAIAEALKVNSSVSRIDLMKNSIGNEGAIAIAEALKVNSSLKVVFQCRNSINRQTKKSLESLHKSRVCY
ncbi:hypothetical protein GEMRC1_008327 [Eukaryota sp. GEM-RC1]